jgi:CHAD domain-containing protein
MARSSDQPASLEQFVAEQVQELRQLLPRALKAKDVDAIHDARVATRRLRAAIDLASPLLADEPRRRFLRALRRLRRTLGPLRDLDVMLVHLQEFRTDGRHANAVDWLEGQLRKQRAKSARTCCKKMTSRSRLAGLRSWEKLRRDIRQGEQAIKMRAESAVPAQLASFREKADALSRSRATTAIDAGPDVHELRIAGKLLRYALEFAAPLGFRLSPAVLRSFKRLQDALGLWHDYIVLSEHAIRSATDESLSLHQPRLYGDVLAFAHRLWRPSEGELARFVRLWDRDGERLSADILASFQSPARRAPRKQTQQADAPQTPPASAVPKSNGQESTAADVPVAAEQS